MHMRTVHLRGHGLRGERIDAALLRDMLKLLLEGSQRALRLRTQGRSVARGATPNWIQKAADVVLRITEGSTKLEVEAPSIRRACPQEFAQTQLFPELDPDLPAFDYLAETITAAVTPARGSQLYDRSFLSFLEDLEHVFSQGVQSIELSDSGLDGNVKALLTLERLAGLRALEARIPEPQYVRLVGKLDTIRHTDRTFVLTVNQGAHVRGIAESDQVPDLRDLWGTTVLVSGTARFTAEGDVQRVEAEVIRVATSEELAVWAVIPTPLSRPIPSVALRREQGPRSGIASIIGQWPGDESDDRISALLDELS